MDVRFWHAIGVGLETSVGVAILEFPAVLIARADGDCITRHISRGSGWARQRDRDLLHLANGFPQISTVGGVQVVRHALDSMLKVCSVIRTGVIEDNIFGNVLVPALEFVLIRLCRGSACCRIIPSVTRAATSSASVVVVVPPGFSSGRRSRSVILLLYVVPNGDLLGYVIHSDCQYDDDD